MKTHLFRQPSFATWLSSIYLLVYILLLHLDTPFHFYIADTMLLFSPALLAWLTYTIIRYGHFDDRELSENEEYGYGRP